MQGLGATEGRKDRNVLTLTCPKTSTERLWGLKSIIECGIVMVVIRSDAPNADRTKIFLLRENATFFQSCSGAAVRETSAM